MLNRKGHSPAAEVMDEAIQLALEERSPYPERSFFLDADMASVAGTHIMSAAEEGRSLVLVDADKSVHILTPEEARSIAADAAA